MSLLYNESFVRFGDYVGPDDFSAPVTAQLLAHAANLRRDNYEVKIAANTSAATSGGLLVREDPLVEGQNNLVHSAGSTAPGNNGITGAFRRTLKITDEAIIVGFSLYIPPDFVKHNASSTVACLRLAATTKADTAWEVLAITPIYGSKELFRITQDLQVRWGTDAAMSAVTLTAGVLNYVEFRIGPNEVRVWINDVFVMQKIVSVVPETIAWIFENNINAGGGTQMTGNAGRWAIGNMYYLLEDTIAPNVRLGPSTRVIGSRPEADVDVDFNRPAGFASNAAVAAQDLVDSPAAVLQAQNVGDFDIYSSSGGASVANMSLVHAVTSKALASNLEPATHTIRGLIHAGVANGADAKNRMLDILTNKLPFNVYGMAIRPGTTVIYAVGSGSNIYKSGANYDISNWTPVYSDASGYTCLNIVFDNAGRGYILRNSIITTTQSLLNAAVLLMAAGGDALTVGSAASANAKNDILVAPSGAPVITTANTVATAVYTLTSANSGSTWTAKSTTTADGNMATNGIAGMAKNATRIVGTFAVGSSAVFTSDDNGANWAERVHGGIGVGYGAIVYDGTAFIMAGASLDTGNGGAPAVRRSVDGASWSPANFGGSNVAGTLQTLTFGVANTSSHEVIFGGNAGAMIASKNGLDWRALPRLTTSNLRAGVCLPSGDFVFSGDTGVLLTYKAEPIDTSLVPFASYASVFNSAIFNPSTGAPWTPAAAAVAQFGAKITT